MDRILIVDDEFLIRYTLEEGLKDRGYDAYSAATVEEGLEFVRKYHPGVLLLDNLLENSVGRRLVFKVEAFDAKGSIGGGTHERFIIKNEKFLAKAQSKKEN